MTISAIDSLHIDFTEQSLWVMNIALGLVMFGIALDISLNDFKRLWLQPKPLFVGVFSQFVLLPAVTFILVLLISPIPSIALGMFMVAACPGGNISNFITHIAKGNSALSISLTAVATLLAVVMTPINLQLWGSLYSPTAIILKEVAISPWEMVKLVALLLGLPLVLGMYLNHIRPNLASKLAKILKLVSIICFVVLIVVALFNNRDIFMDYVFYVFWIVVIHNLLAFVTGYSFANIMGLSQANKRTLAIETGIQNSGLGLLLIFTFFDGMGGMALLAAFWGVWHIISGLAVASFWSFKPIDKLDKKELA
ncbi:bile acid:sodium symporter family protein [Arenibacter certesii]|uniref:Symporter n=1 Tax=Arenibacter certesii TaxID=228955 RepID=A0A918IQM6_9FLAO|nr:bile acid:sodium symporter family protein [Arenibacter certesii]GGW27103.1 symporter [Arenibacter certesii]